MIHVENLTRFYGDVCAVDHVSFDINKGEILGLLGPNGAGKTTTLRMLTGYLRPSKGTIRIKDYTIAEHPLEVKRMLGYLPESAPLYHDMLVYDYLGYIAAIHRLESRDSGARIRQLSDLCGLAGVMHKPIADLSKGYKQRVGLAHAMMSDPEILILDEPTSGLDPNQIVEIREIIKQIGRHKTVILSTHILSEAEATCDRVMIINQGKIVADGSTETLKRSAAEEQVIAVTLTGTDSETAREHLLAIEGIRSVTPADSDSDQVALQLNCEAGTAVRQALYARIKETDWVLYELVPQERTLENIFRELTKEH